MLDPENKYAAIVSRKSDCIVQDLHELHAVHHDGGVSRVKLVKDQYQTVFLV